MAAHRDGQPAGTVAGLVDHLVEGLVELERGEQGAVVARVAARSARRSRRGTAVRAASAQRGCRAARVRLLPASRPRSRTSAACRRRRAAGGRGRCARTGGAAARPRSRAAPSRGRGRRAPGRGGSRRGCVAGAGQSRGRGRSEDLARGLVVGGERRAPRCWRWRGAPACWPAARPGRRRWPRPWAAPRPGWRAPRPWRAPRARARSLKSSPRGQRLAGDAPGVLDARQELLREREVADGDGRRGAARRGHCPDTCPNGRGTSVRPAEGERRLHDDVGVLAVVQDPEHLADQRLCAAVTARGVVDDRGVGLLAAQHPGRA